MTTPLEKLEQAKLMLDNGLISQDMFEQISKVVLLKWE